MTVGVGVYIGLFIVAVGLLVLWKAKRRRERAPLEFRLLRAPGECLRRRLAKFDEDAVFRVGGAAVAPLVAASVPLWLIAKFKPQDAADPLADRPRRGFSHCAGASISVVDERPKSIPQ
jgi:hypothetical protein